MSRKKAADKNKGKGSGWLYLVAGAMITLIYLIVPDLDLSVMLRDLRFDAGPATLPRVEPTNRDDVVAVARDVIVGRVVRISDGDTLTVLDESHREHKIRLANIDAPERGQPYGDAAREAVGALCHDRVVSVQIKEVDQYGRQVGWIRVDGQNVNHRLVQEGMAWHYRRYSKSLELDALELEARTNRRGLWQDAQPIPPWEWRKQRRSRS